MGNFTSSTWGAFTITKCLKETHCATIGPLQEAQQMKDEVPGARSIELFTHVIHWSTFVFSNIFSERNWQTDACWNILPEILFVSACSLTWPWDKLDKLDLYFWCMKSLATFWTVQFHVTWGTFPDNGGAVVCGTSSIKGFREEGRRFPSEIALSNWNIDLEFWIHRSMSRSQSDHMNMLWHRSEVITLPNFIASYSHHSHALSSLSVEIGVLALQGVHICKVL